MKCENIAEQVIAKFLIASPSDWGQFVDSLYQYHGGHLSFFGRILDIRDFLKMAHTAYFII
jgi:hypothetical protein